MHWSPEKEQVFRFASNCAVAAGAGSGKTAALVELYDRLVGGLVPEIRSVEPGALGLGVEEIVAITFTEKAAHEMRERIRRRIEERIDKGENLAWWDAQRRSLLGATIATFHSYCATLLREHPVEAGVDPDFTVLEEREAESRLRAAAEEAVVGKVRAGEAATIALVERMGIEENGVGLVPSLIELARSVWGAGHSAPELAGLALRQAANGDEKWPPALVRLAADLQECVVEAAKLPAPKSAGATEPRRRLVAGLSEAADRIGRLARRGLGALSTPAGRSEARSALDLVANLDLPRGKGVDSGFKDRLESVRARCSADARAPQDAPALLFSERAAAPHLTALIKLLIDVEDTYAAAKKRDSGLDFDDLQRKARDLLRDHPVLRAAVKSRIRVLLVDEFQDTNPPQRELVYLLAEDRDRSDLFPEDTRLDQAIRIAPRTLFVVGDPKQSIYLFRGADVGLFVEVLDDLTRRGGERIAFRDNFRSVTGILSVVNALFRGLMPGGAQTDEIAYDQDARLERGRGDSGREADVELIVGVDGASAGDRRAAEAAALADRILDLVDPGSGFRVLEEEGRRPARYGDVAILFRALSDVAVYERELRLREVPYFLVKGRGFYAAQEVWDLRNLLRFLETGDPISLLGVLRSPLVGLSDDACAALVALPGAPRDLARAFWTGPPPGSLSPEDQARCGEARAWIAALQRTKDRLTPAEILERALESTRAIAACLSLPQGAQAAANVKKFVERARDFRRRGAGGLREFVLLTDRLIREEEREAEAPVTAEGADVVRCMTIHQAKGLEFPIVFLPDIGRPSPPHRERVRYDPRSGLALRLPSEDGDGSIPTASSRRVFDDLARREAEESKRLLYVAMTRARDYLILSGEAGPRTRGTWRAAVDDWLGGKGGGEGEAAPRLIEMEGARIRLLPANAIPRRSIPATRSLADRLGELPDPTAEDRRAADLVLAAALDPPPRPAAPAPLVVTALGEFSRCARRTLYAHVLGLDESDRDRGEDTPAEGGLTPAERGTIAHAVLERYPLPGGRVPTSPCRTGHASHPEVPPVSREATSDDRSVPAPTAASLIDLDERALGASDEERQRLIDDLTAFIEGPIWARMAAASPERELPFVCPLVGPGGPPLLLSGTMDACFFDAGGGGTSRPPGPSGSGEGLWTVVEYKYARRSAEAEEHYRLQLQAYALALHRALGAAPVRAWLCFLRDRGRAPIEVVVRGEEFPAIEARLRETGLRFLAAHASRDEAHWPKVEETACRRITCGYRRRCGR